MHGVCSIPAIRIPRRTRGVIHRVERGANIVLMTGVHHPAIRTPDQRIRVFVSSTLRELADERARRARGDRAAAPRAGHVRARRAPAPAPRALPLLPRAERRLRRHLLARATAGSRPTRRSPASRTSTTSPRAAMPKLIYIKASDHRDERLDRADRRASAPTTPPPTCPSATADELARARRRRPRHPPRRALRRVRRARRRRADAATVGAAGARARRRTPRRSAARTTSPRVRDLLARGDAPRRQPRRPRRDRQEPARDRGRAARAATSSPTASTSCRSRACSSRGCCCRRSRTRLGIRDNGEAALEERIAHALGGPAGADRARQLRADRRGRARRSCGSTPPRRTRRSS